MHINRKRFLSLTFSLASVGGLGVGLSASDASAVMAMPGGPNDAEQLVTPSTEGGRCMKDEQVPRLECRALTSSTCEGSRTFAAHCAEYEANLKPREANRAAQCLAHAPSCEGTTLLHCAAEAIGAACPDPTAEGFCKPLVATCTKESGARLPLGECVNFVSGLSERGRAALATCVTEGHTVACTLNPEFCLDVYP